MIAKPRTLKYDINIKFIGMDLMKPRKNKKNYAGITFSYVFRISIIKNVAK